MTVHRPKPESLVSFWLESFHIICAGAISFLVELIEETLKKSTKKKLFGAQEPQWRNPVSVFTQRKKFYHFSRPRNCVDVVHNFSRRLVRSITDLVKYLKYRQQKSEVLQVLHVKEQKKCEIIKTILNLLQMNKINPQIFCSYFWA